MAKILLIEDAEIWRVYSRDMLPMHTITAVGTLAAGLAKVRQEPWDVIILDLGLPDSAGLDTYAALIEESGLTPILIATGAPDLTAPGRLVIVKNKAELRAEVYQRVIQDLLDQRQALPAKP